MTRFLVQPHLFSRFISAILLIIVSICAASLAHAQSRTLSSIDEKVLNLFALTYATECTSLEVEQQADMDFEKWNLSFSYESDTDIVRPYALYRIHCYNGAYNEIHAFFGVDEYDEVRQIHFAQPHFDILYPDDDYESTLYKIQVRGFSTAELLVNSGYDPETQSIYEYSKWRGFGDASSAGHWIFHRGRFVLKSYDVDASYDGNYHQQRIFGDGDPNEDY